MSKKGSLLVRVIGRVINAVAIVAPGLGSALAWRVFCYPPPWRPEDADEARFKAQGEAIVDRAERGDVVLDGGQRVATYVWRNDGTARGRVLLVHGWTGTAAAMAAFVEPLRARRFDVVALDMPGHGRSSGYTHAIDLGARVVIAVAGKLGPFDAAITHSHGGASFGASLGGLPTVAGSIRVARAAMIASPNSVGKLVHRFAKEFNFRDSVRKGLEARTEKAAGLPLADIVIGRFVASSGPALLVVHDRGDKVVSVEEGEALATIAHGELVETSDLGHKKVVADEGVIKRVVGFIGE